MSAVDWPAVTRANGFIAPLLWHHGESPEVIGSEIWAMYTAGIRSFVLEPRPHPDYLGQRWWDDVESVIRIARSLEMRFWLFDDGKFPSGSAGGRVPAEHPELLKRFLFENHVDVTGPRPTVSFNVGAWLEPGDEMVAVIASKQQAEEMVLEESVVDLTPLVSDGRVGWSVPAGRWRVHIVVITPRGGEQETRDYLNPVDPRSAGAYIEMVHAQHYARFGEHFGTTILGFFQDEPRFGNVESYNAILGSQWVDFPYASPRRATGNHEMPLPHSDALLEGFLARGGEGALATLPLLWFDSDGDAAARARFDFMDVASTLFANYLGELGDWCRAHDVGLIGHLIEDDGAHSRLGYGPGHYFRAIAAQDAAGIDVVCQIFPGEIEGRNASPFGNLDNEFFYWGLAKLASSAAHFDPRTAGTAMVEAFGAYGWQLGLPLMKWLTDHLCVRGINYFVPHAFSPRVPDPDCPPHFYNGGQNPQWAFFFHWVAYTQRLCELLSGGSHAAPVAVLYHAEAEWVGLAMGFEKVVRVLAESQLDADVVPLDRLREGIVTARRLQVAGETYDALVVPGSERISVETNDTLVRLSREGLTVIYVETRGRPVGGSVVDPEGDRTVALSELVCELRPLLGSVVHASDTQPNLRVYHYVKDGVPTFFLVNESVTGRVDTTIRLPADGNPRSIDLMTGAEGLLQFQADRGETILALGLAPGESLFVTFGGSSATPTAIRDWRPIECALTGWRVSLSTGPSVAYTMIPEIPGPGDLGNGKHAEFSGTIRYEATFVSPDIGTDLCLDLGEVYDVVEVALNGESVAVRFARPYFVVLPARLLRDGDNDLVLVVTTNPSRSKGHNTFDRSRPSEPLGLLGPIGFSAATEDAFLTVIEN